MLNQRYGSNNQMRGLVIRQNKEVGSLLKFNSIHLFTQLQN